MMPSIMISSVVEGLSIVEEVAVTDDCEEVQIGSCEDLTDQRMMEEKCLETSRRCVGLLRMAEESGTTTTAELAHQGSQLRRVEKQLDGVEADLKESASEIHSMRSLFGKFKHFTRKKSRKKSTPASVTSERTDIPVDYDTDLRSCRSATPSPTTMHSNDRIKAILNRHLDDMNKSVAFLKQLAIDLREELEAQDKVNQRVFDKLENTQVGITQQTRKINQLL